MLLHYYIEEALPQRPKGLRFRARRMMLPAADVLLKEI